MVDLDCACGHNGLVLYARIDELLHGEQEQEKDRLSTAHSGFVGLWAPQSLSTGLLITGLRTPVNLINNEKIIMYEHGA